MDLQGRLRVSSSLRYSGQQVMLPVSELLEAGMYTFTLQTDSGTATGKVVVQLWYVLPFYLPYISYIIFNLSSGLL